jgi:hypothetical protein
MSFNTVIEKYSQFLRNDIFSSVYQYLSGKGVKIYYPYHMFIFMYCYFLRMPKQIFHNIVFSCAIDLNKSHQSGETERQLISSLIDVTKISYSRDKYYPSQEYRDVGDKICSRWQRKYEQRGTLGRLIPELELPKISEENLLKNNKFDRIFIALVRRDFKLERYSLEKVELELKKLNIKKEEDSIDILNPKYEGCMNSIRKTVYKQKSKRIDISLNVEGMEIQPDKSEPQINNQHLYRASRQHSHLEEKINTLFFVSIDTKNKDNIETYSEQFENIPLPTPIEDDYFIISGNERVDDFKPIGTLTPYTILKQLKDNNEKLKGENIPLPTSIDDYFIISGDGKVDHLKPIVTPNPYTILKQLKDNNEKLKGERDNNLHSSIEDYFIISGDGRTDNNLHSSIDPHSSNKNPIITQKPDSFHLTERTACITIEGKQRLDEATEFLRSKYNAKVVYSDSDSTFVNITPHSYSTKTTTFEYCEAEPVAQKILLDLMREKGLNPKVSGKSIYIDEVD